MRFFYISFIAFLLALGSYESSVMLPFLILVHRVFNYHGTKIEKAHRKMLASFYITILISLAGYFLLRKILFNDFIGGYALIKQRLVSVNFRPVIDDLLANLRIFNPAFGNVLTQKVKIYGNCFIIIIISITFIKIFFSNFKYFRLLLFAFVWIVIFHVPVIFARITVENGRFWYLPSVGVCLTFSIIANEWGSSGKNKLKDIAIASGVLILLLYYSFLLNHYIDQYKRAGELARKIQSGLMLACNGITEETPVIFFNCPDSIKDKSGTKFAPVYSIRIRDSIASPFADFKTNLFAAPEVSEEMREAFFFAENNRVRFLIWDNRLEEVRILKYAYTDRVLPLNKPNIKLLYPKNNSKIQWDPAHAFVSFERKQYSFLHLILLTEIFPMAKKFSLKLPEDSVVKVDIASGYLDLNVLYPHHNNKVFWWVSALGEDKTIIAYSQLNSFTVINEKTD